MATFKKLMVLFSLLATATQARAQFVGFVSPQTVASTPFNNVACTGGTQLATVPNLGQSSHFATFITVGNPNRFQLTIQGSWDGTNFVQISDTLMTNSGAVQGTGYYPVVRILVTCSAGVNFTVNYSGMGVTTGNNAGALLFSQTDKALISAASAGTTLQSLGFGPPWSNSSGTLFFNYAGAGPAGSTLTVTCLEGLAGNQLVFGPFALATTTGVTQSFNVPAAPCQSVTVTYTAGGASASGYSLDYGFNAPGFTSGTTGTSATQVQTTGADPCLSTAIAKSSAVVTAPAAATTQIVAGVAGQQISVCGYNLGMVVAVTGTLQWTTGTGGTCGAATVPKTGAIPINTAEPFSYSTGGTIFTAAAGSGVCLTSTGAGDNAAGILTYVQQ